MRLHVIKLSRNERFGDEFKTYLNGDIFTMQNNVIHV